VDTDWTISAPEYADIMLTSILKNMDLAVYSAIQAVIQGTFEGGIYIGTLANDGVGIATPNAVVSAEMLAELETVKAGIINGDITIGG
jgi:basic membrane protein A